MNPQTRTTTAHPDPAPSQLALAAITGILLRPATGKTETLEAIRAIAERNGQGVQR